jgi:DNA-binding GntR family transcriptional regulator
MKNTNVLLRDGVYEAIRSEILACRLAPGEDMREQELAVRFDVSRQPVREALLRLEQERLVTVLPRQGYRVNAVSVSDARDLLRFRLVLEPACAVEACERGTGTALEELDGFRVFAAGGQDDGFTTYNRLFHTALTMAGGNRRMARAARELIEQSDRLTRVSLNSIRGRDPAQLVDEHCAIIDAVQERDGRTAARLVRDHIARAEKRILSALSRAVVVN